MDMARFLLGEIVEVQAAGGNFISEEIAEVGDIDSASIMMRGADGTLCQIVDSRRYAFGYDQRVEAFGELGMLTVENLRPSGVRFAGGAATEVADPYLSFYLDRYIPSYRAELDHFVRAVETGTPPEPGFADGRATLALADAAGSYFFPPVSVGRLEGRTPPAWVSDTAKRQSVRPPAGST